MLKHTFTTTDELKKFIIEAELGEVTYCTNPDYIDAIIGITDEGKIVYDRDLMIRHLEKIYEKEGDSDDPYNDAVEWIDYNCDIPYWEIIYTDDGEGYGEMFDEPKLDNVLGPYANQIIGTTTHGILLIDSDGMTNENIEDFEKRINKFDIQYKIL
jgi:hypothetical protein